jgi:hypothetical protein
LKGFILSTVAQPLNVIAAVRARRLAVFSLKTLDPKPLAWTFDEFISAFSIIKISM